VCAGHPDKICDAISDAIVDEALRLDPTSKVAVETLVTKQLVVLAGEVTTAGTIDYESIARRVIKGLGYTDPAFLFDHTVPVLVKIHAQSPEIAAGVDQDGAGDQGMMFGYACTQTDQLMPLPIVLAHALTYGIDQARISKAIPYLRPDGKAQVTLQYDQRKPVAVTSIVVAVPHQETIKHSELVDDLYQQVIKPALNTYQFTFPKRKSHRQWHWSLVFTGSGL
jgi:S-adenosylmethionine synthetase